jgi:hypothetical protein
MYLGIRLKGLALVHGLDKFGTDSAEQMLPERLLVHCAVSSTLMTTTARFGCDAAIKALVRFQQKANLLILEVIVAVSRILILCGNHTRDLGGALCQRTKRCEARGKLLFRLRNPAAALAARKCRGKVLLTAEDVCIEIKLYERQRIDST